MAFLLGNESCIESLRTDLRDIQQTIDEILIRVGPVKCYSWKSPDKLASDLKINDLIEMYKYGDDEINNQVSHYSLLELIIDRLLLLVYVSTNLIDDDKPSSSKINRLSAGLTIKKYWNKFTQMCTSYRHLKSINTRPKSIKSSTEDLKKSFLGSSTPKKISDETSSKSVQTNETAFVPCESCAKVQTNLKQNADQIINMCHYQNITSQVGKFRSNLMANQLVGGWLNGTDLEKWLIEQDKDLTKIAKQLEYLSKNNDLLKTKLNDNEALIIKLNSNEKDLKKNLKEEQETKEITVKQYEKKLNDQKNDLQKKINSLEQELKNLNQLKITLEEKNESLKNLYDNNEKIVVELSETNKALSQELNNKNELRMKILSLEEEKLSLNKELEYLKRDLNEKTSDLNSERSKLENLIREDQSLKLKHETILESVDKLSAENETFRKKIDYIEEEKKQILDSVKFKESQIESLKYESDILQNSILNLKEEIKKLKDNELLLLKYPDLYGPMEIQNENELNVTEDMQNQINANKHRIQLLENLNKKLEISVKKLNQHQSETQNESLNEKNYFMKPEPSSTKTSRPSSNISTAKVEKYVLSRPVPLFKLESEMEIENTSIGKQREESPCSDLDTEDNFDRVEDDDDEEFNFLKDKHQSDQDYLNKLNQINQTSELKIENSDFVYNRMPSRRGSGSKENTFLFSPSVTSIQNQSRIQTGVNRGNLKTPPIPPADKNMEVIVGKGRRLNSATSSARSNSATKKNESARKPPTPTQSGRGFKCDICLKKYEDSKNLEIHKIYCKK